MAVKAAAEQFALVRILWVGRFHLYSRNYKDMMVNQIVSDNFKPSQATEKTNINNELSSLIGFLRAGELATLAERIGEN